jgi:glutamate/aspartate transport system ATP-binding protein
VVRQLPGADRLHHHISKGEVVVVCGPSGSGKSTLIKTVNALEPFQKGDIVVDGISIADPKTNLPKLRSRVGMVFQHFELFPHLSVTENLTLAQIKVLGRSVTTTPRCAA